MSMPCVCLMLSRATQWPSLSWHRHDYEVR
jgi:hypothetical protein